MYTVVVENQRAVTMKKHSLVAGTAAGYAEAL